MLRLPENQQIAVYREDMPSPLGKVPQCVHWGGRGFSLLNFAETQRKTEHSSAPLPVRQSRTTLPKGEGFCPINGNLTLQTEIRGSCGSRGK